MRVGKTTIYGLFAVLHIANRADDKPVQGKEIAEAYEIPFDYLLKILQMLARGGVLRSVRGRSGGFLLGRPAGEITVADIVGVLEPVPELAQLLEESVPGHSKVKTILRKIHAESCSTIQESLQRITMQELVHLDKKS